jgi:ferrochelatase
VKLAVVLFNLGGPDGPDAVEPFLRNLFADPAVVSLPGLIRWPLAWMIAAHRAPIAREIYARIGCRSPILEETQSQASALERLLKARGHEARVFVAMRYWKPFSDDTASVVVAWRPERTVLLPLYPQFSTTTSASSIRAWSVAARGAGLVGPQSRICCYPRGKGFIAAVVALIREAWARRRPGIEYRLLLTAHGLPKRIIGRGDPYQWQVEQSAAGIVAGLAIKNLDWTLGYQSRVGPLQWIGPATDDEIRKAAGRGLVVAPIAFVSEHSETLVELDMEYAKLAGESGVMDYIRVPTVGIHPGFIDGLAEMVLRAADGEEPVTDCGYRVCPGGFRRCGFDGGQT